MRVCEDHETVQLLFSSGLPLGVACQACSHRTLIKPNQLGAHEGDRRQLCRLPLLCRCGRRDVGLFILETPDDAPAFLAGETPPRNKGERSAGLWQASF